MKVLLSYPRSGNHLFRFFIELLTELPTLGCIENINDVPIYLNKFIEEIPFNINELSSYDNNLYIKYHTIPNITHDVLILIVRNPNEVLLRHNNYNIVLDENIWDNYEEYFKLIDYFNIFSGKKKVFFYEDMIIDKIKFIEELYLFLNINNEKKKHYVIENIEKLYELSKLGENRSWGGVNSNDINFYYKKIPDNIKEEFDNYIQNKLKSNNYDLIKDKYFVNNIL